MSDIHLNINGSTREEELKTYYINVMKFESPLTVNIVAKIIFDCNYGAKGDGWCWTRFYLYVDGELKSQQYFTKSNNGTDRVSELSTTVSLEEGFHKVLIKLLIHASSGDGAENKIKTIKTVAHNTNESFNGSNMHFVDKDKEYVFYTK